MGGLGEEAQGQTSRMGVGTQGQDNKTTPLWVPFPPWGLLPWLPVSHNCLAEGPGQPAGCSQPQPITMIPQLCPDLGREGSGTYRVM